MNAIAKKENGQLLVPMPSRQILKDYARSGAVLFGDSLRCNGKSGDWTAGQQGLEIDKQTELVCLIHLILAGHTKWGDDGIIDDQRLVPLAEFGTAKIHRATCGDHDRSLWKMGENGRPDDPWDESVWVPMINRKTRAEYTFMSNSFGGVRAVKHLIDAFEKHWDMSGRDTPSELPIVSIDSESYQHRDRKKGTIFNPLLDVVGWVPINNIFGDRQSELDLPAPPASEEPPPVLEIPPEPEQYAEPDEPAMAAAAQARARRRANI